jgi:hypothetical protein
MAAAKKTAAAPPPASDIRTAFLAAPARYRTAVYESDLGPVVLRDLGFFSTLELEGMSKRASIVFMLTRCAFRPVLGEDGQPLIGEDGQPLTGKPLFEASDEEWLRVTDHPIDGPVFRLVTALSGFLGGSAGEAGVGKPSTTG